MAFDKVKKEAETHPDARKALEDLDEQIKSEDADREVNDAVSEIVDHAPGTNEYKERRNTSRACASAQAESIGGL